MKNNFRVLMAIANALTLVGTVLPAAEASAPAQSVQATVSSAPTLKTLVTGRGYGQSVAVRKALERLEKAFTWIEVLAPTTYAAVVLRAQQALKALERQVCLAPESVPDSATYLGALNRLVTESTYLTERTGAPGFDYGVLDSEMFLWHLRWYSCLCQRRD